MLTRMTDDDWAVALHVFRAVRSRRGDKGRNDRKFLEAMHYFTLNNVSWRALPAEFGPWNSVWKRFWRLRQAGVFEAFFETLADLSDTAHLVQMFDSTVVRAHVSAAGANVWPAPSASGFSVSGLNSLHKRIRPSGEPLAKMESRASWSS